LSDLGQLEDVVSDLVRRAQSGDVAAREEVLRRCHSTIYRWALVHTAGDADEADDIAQDVLVRLYRFLDRYAGRARFTTWLYRVTQNVARGWRRRLSSRLRVVRTLAAEPEPLDHGADAVQQLQGSRITEVVMALFQRLPARQREVFNLADLEGIALVEIAQRLGVTPSTARAHLFRARRTLRAGILASHPELAEERER
jgi:RNA polymerase sigma-70 factor, ECF subfamily